MIYRVLLHGSQRETSQQGGALLRCCRQRPPLRQAQGQASCLLKISSLRRVIAELWQGRNSRRVLPRQSPVLYPHAQTGGWSVTVHPARGERQPGQVFFCIGTSPCRLEGWGCHCQVFDNQESWGIAGTIMRRSLSRSFATLRGLIQCVSRGPADHGESGARAVGREEAIRST
jgi:hypothetical protein